MDLLLSEATGITSSAPLFYDLFSIKAVEGKVRRSEECTGIKYTAM